MKKLFSRVIIMLMAVLVVAACGNRAEQGTPGSDNTQAKAETTQTKSAKAKSAKAKNTKAKRKVRSSKKSVLTPTSAGSPYEILIVGEPDDFQNGAVDTLYSILTDDVAGMAQSEPSFKVTKITENNFSRTLRLCRNIIVVNIDKSTYTRCRFKYSKDVYAAPQIIMTIQAPDARSFLKYVDENRDQLVDFFNKAELNRQAELFREDHQPHISEEVKRMFGCEIWAPADLTRLKTGRNFMWARTERFVKNVEQVVNLVVYSYPYRDTNTFTLDYFVHKRDSVMKVNVPGPREGQYMMTSMPFVLVSDETVHGAYAQVVRGLWNIKGYDMGGPFVSVSRVDEKNQRVVVAEAFVFYPNQPKRNVLKRLEAALYTLHLPDELDLQRFQYNLDEIIINPEN